jgi:hypothetical protein
MGQKLRVTFGGMGRKRSASRTEANTKPRGQPASRVVRTAAQYEAKPQRTREAYQRVAKVLTQMRAEKVSLRKAARDIGIRPETVLRWGGSALKKNASGRYTAKPRDSLLRVMTIPTEKGKQEITVKGSRHASILGEYWAAVQKFLGTGNATVLQKFRGKEIKDANGKPITLITDPKELKRLGRAGELSFESIYSKR